ncbi:UPF0481 protein At3g47200-like [Cornus florida]|uniref:UPF0481 protein At3g47200-like n=1 Tax=Cornus florida TaxID=4283 RepID=UPI00289FB3AC|nr:UPF0481 protein At3g47200-like [Cornus florida]
MESSSGVEHVSICIDGKLARHSGLFRERCIFKVHEKLRKLNPDAYEPAVLAIGPYHRGKINLQGMEEVKLQYLKSLLARKEETSAKKYVIAMRELEEEARECYAEPVGLTSDEFVLLDGCFIIELFLKLLTDVAIDENDPIFGTYWMGSLLLLDLILFENQLPFFVLLKLYALIEDTKPEEFVYIALTFFAFFLIKNIAKPRILDMSSIHEVQHLLDLLHRSRCPDPFVRTEKRKGSEWERIQCASQLVKSGIKFEKAEGSSNLFDITCSKRTLKIPHLTIEDRTEPLFRNLIAHEQYSDVNQSCYITNYCFLMDCH